jgi:hypothetical protein
VGDLADGEQEEEEKEKAAAGGGGEGLGGADQVNTNHSSEINGKKHKRRASAMMGGEEFIDDSGDEVR